MRKTGAPVTQWQMAKFLQQQDYQARLNHAKNSRNWLEKMVGYDEPMSYVKPRPLSQFMGPDSVHLSTAPPRDGGTGAVG